MRIQTSSGGRRVDCRDACASVKLTQAKGQEAKDLAALAKFIIDVPGGLERLGNYCRRYGPKAMIDKAEASK